MKSIKVTYWITTGLVALAFLSSAIMYLTQSEEVAKGLSHLGYPKYLIPFLATAKILGAIALIVPKFPRLKEWAYAGIAFDLIGALVSHIALGDYSAIGFIGVFFALLFTSYFTFHKLQDNSAFAIVKS